MRGAFKTIQMVFDLVNKCYNEVNYDQQKVFINENIKDNFLNLCNIMYPDRQVPDFIFTDKLPHSVIGAIANKTCFDFGNTNYINLL